MEAKFNCPKCGNEFEVSVNIKESHNQKSAGTSKNTKMMSRIEQLRNAGVDVTNLFAMQRADGAEFIGRMANGSIALVEDNDPIFKYISENGTINNPHLFRRWVMSQTFRILHLSKQLKSSPSVIIRGFGYKYQTTMLLNEFHAQYRMHYNGDMQNFTDRNRWFNRELVTIVIEDYIEQVVKAYNPDKCCLGSVRISPERFGAHLKDVKGCLNSVNNCPDDPLALSIRFHNFSIKRIKSSALVPCKEWIDAYKGAGAFFTMQNLFRFHGCSFTMANDTKLTGEEAVKHLQDLAERYKQRGWMLYGVLKEILTINSVDIEAKMTGWRKAKTNKNGQRNSSRNLTYKK